MLDWPLCGQFYLAINVVCERVEDDYCLSYFSASTKAGPWKQLGEAGDVRFPNGDNWI